MGNWRNRRRHFYNQNRTPRYCSYDEPEPSPPHRDQEYVDDGVPSWEKNFCFLIGSVPWRKVVSVKKFMYCHSNVLNWDDSAGEVSFQNAKQRYWAEINGLPCDISLPDPNIYIDKINWNPYIDPDLVDDLEREFFAPDEGEQNKVGRKNKRTRKFVSIPSEGCNMNPGNVDDPWECNNNMQSSVSLIDKVQGWNTTTNKSSDLKNDDNPWERGFTQGSEVVKGNGWGDCGNNAWGWNQSGSHVNQSENWNNNANKWERSCQGTCPVEDKSWANYRDASWGRNQQESRKVNDGGNSWGTSLSQAIGTMKNCGWRDSGGHVWSEKHRDNYIKDPNNLESRKLIGSWGDQNNACQKREGNNEHITTGWGDWNNGCYKREGTHQHITGYRNMRFQRDDYQTGQIWNRGKTKKRVSFAVE